MNNPIPPTGLLAEDQAAAFLGMSPRFLQNRRSKGGGPEYIRLSHRCVRYHPDALQRWIDDRSYFSTCQEPSSGAQPQPENDRGPE
mgnify:CR=1 FL=1|jgi:hypothetical protein